MVKSSVKSLIWIRIIYSLSNLLSIITTKEINTLMQPS